MLLHDVVAASAAVGATRSRTAKVTVLADLLRRAAPEEVGVVTAYLSGTTPQRRLGVGWRSLAGLPAPAPGSTLTVEEVHRRLGALAALAGSGSGSARADALAGLFSRATDEEQDFLRRLVTGEIRQGALDGVMQLAIAQAAAVPEEEVRRAVMLAGQTAPVAAVALRDGVAGLRDVTLEVGRPLRPMLAASAPDVAAGVAALAPDGGEVLVDGKLDGIRIQAHRRGRDVRVFTRSLEDITDRLPEVVEAVRGLPVDTAVLDGEAISLDAGGRPRPFQDIAARTASTGDPTRLRDQVPLRPYFFDLLHVDGSDLLEVPARERLHRMDALLPQSLVVPRLRSVEPAEVQAFFDGLVARGHEGVVLKSPAAPYAAGRRGSGWVKVKPRHTLDLVVLAVEWGSGRRQGLLSNIHLGARDPRTGGFVMLGKTFKGMTDEMLAWQTERFLSLETGRERHVVHVRPEQVVEVAFDGVQRSPRYPGGVALRFARVLRYRDDKGADEADSIETVLGLHSSP